MSGIDNLLLAGGIALTIGAVVISLRALLRKAPQPTGESDENVTVKLLRDQYDDLESEREAGKITAEQFDQLTSELADRLKSELDAAAANKKTGDKATPVALIVVVALLVPLSTAGLYKVLGTPEGVSIAAPVEDASGEPLPDEVVQMVAGLEAKLAADPNDPAGWQMLGRSYRVMARYQDALNAYEKALQHGYAENPDVLLETVEVVTLKAEHEQLDTYPTLAKLLAYQAVELAPEHPKALWYAHIAAANSNELQRAVVYLERLKEMNPPPEVLTVVNRQLIELSEAGAKLSKPIEAAEPTRQEATSDKRLALTIEVDASLQAQIKAGAQLYVFAKAVDGSPMPLAVSRTNATAGAQVIELHDGLGLMPTAKFSAFDQWRITARISQHGSVEALSGDLYADEVVLSIKEQGSVLRISKVAE